MGMVPGVDYPEGMEVKAAWCELQQLVVVTPSDVHELVERWAQCKHVLDSEPVGVAIATEPGSFLAFTVDVTGSETQCAHCAFGFDDDARASLAEIEAEWPEFIRGKEDEIMEWARKLPNFHEA